jgi:hypothetical protein
MSEQIRTSEPTLLSPPKIDATAGWKLLSDYREGVAALALTPPSQYTSQQRGLLMLVLSVVSAELDQNAPVIFGGRGSCASAKQAS